MEIYKEEKKRVKRCMYQSKIYSNDQLGRKMNWDIMGNKVVLEGSE